MDDLISRLNICISKIDSDNIQEHIDKGDLDDWIQEWRIEAASLSFGLFSQIDWLPSAEPREVIYSGDGYADGEMVYDMANCPNCDYEFEESNFIWGCKFCPECGQALDWGLDNADTLDEVASHIKAIPSAEPKTGHCKECKYFEYDSVAKVDGVPLIVAHEICNKWGGGCKTREDGYCFLFEPQEKRCEDCNHYGKFSLDCGRCDDDCSMYEPQERSEDAT